MKRGRWLAAAAMIALVGAGLAIASPPPPQDADPIGDILANPPTVDPAPPPPVQPPQAETPPPQTVAAEADEEEEEEEEQRERAELPPAPPADPLPRTRHQVAIIQALDKVTAETIRFEAPVGQERRWRGLVFRVRACETTGADEAMQDSIAYLEVRSQPRTRQGQATSRRIFQGWMFASSPGLNPLEHPLYDVWVISCQERRPSA